ncbi:hypothetical protein K2173_026963 [Erythroxylum novogranatense]|uniref:Serine/threonine-protein kinase ATM n=1 Tax=Erythroxylum novogranatense TaxID=1862640 RepID=A0AAV8TXQ7_9ROSI|nr:hypothetical protein K2173_026963 [Erythroxylum novogranatense]
MVTSRDVQEIVSKLSSDKARPREEGIKLLNTWLEGERSIRFCKYLGENTSKLKPDDIPHTETWPFLVKLLIQCVSLEIAGSKKRVPKITFAKTLRVVVQRSEDAKFAGKTLALLPVVKSLFSHIWDVLCNVPSFQPEYGIILRHLLTVRGYQFHLKNRIYSGLVLLYIERVETSLGGKSSSRCNQKEEAFRCILTLHALLEHPPGDFPDDVREGIVKGFVQIFSFTRDEGKISRKLIECVNTYLLKDGPNLGYLSLEIHNAVRQFVFCWWLTTRDRGFKDLLIIYARLQLNLTRGAADGSSLVEQLLDVLCKELDQSSLTGVGVPWTEATKDDKIGSLSGSQFNLVELASLVLYRACINTAKSPTREKRLRREHAGVLLKEALMRGKWLWNAAFCSLVRDYYTRLSKDLFIDWFEAISSSFERIVSDANVTHTYDGLLWTIRSLQVLSATFLIPDCKADISSGSSSLPNKFHSGWGLIWKCLMHGLPVFSNISTVVDAVFILLGNIMSKDLINTFFVPQDVWDLKIFKQTPSMATLYFITCYFSHKGSHVDLQDSLHLRKNLMGAVLFYLNWKETSTLNERMVLLLPAAVYALCAGCAPFIHYYEGFFCPSSFSDDCHTTDDGDNIDGHEHARQCKLFDCFVEVIASIDSVPKAEVALSQHHQNVHLPRQLRDQLLYELEAGILGTLLNKDTEQMSLSGALFVCALLSNFIHGALTVRKREETSSFSSKMGDYLLQSLDHITKRIQENNYDFQALGCLGFSSDYCERTLLLASMRSFLGSALFVKREEETNHEVFHHHTVNQSIERLLRSLVKLYEQFSEGAKNLDFEPLAFNSTNNKATLLVSGSLDSSSSRIVDEELDVNKDDTDVDIVTIGGKMTSGVPFSTSRWKMGMISLISSFFLVLDSVTWDILFELMGKECNTKIVETILLHLCQHLCRSVPAKILDLVKIANDMFEMQVNVKFDCVNILVVANQLLSTLLSFDSPEKHVDLALIKRESEPGLMCLRDLINRIGEFGALDWVGRVRLIECICNFILLSPQIGQAMIERLFLLLRDPDYRVRFLLAWRIGVLFQTWDGHEELFQDICSNFGVLLVLPFKGKIVTAKEVLATGPQSPTAIETVIITLMHLALHSEKIELEAIFIMCVVSAIDPCHRELVNAALNNLSRQLHYTSRFKYLEELKGPILFFWVACGVSLAALVEIRHFFVSDVEPSYFMQYCCQWLLPALILHGNTSDLNLVAKVASQSLTHLVRNYFVPIFSVCMALHCSKNSEWKRGALVLGTSILHLADISENERDNLIKRHMVSIVSQILSFTSCSSDPPVPFFSRDKVACAIQTIVDGFLDMEDYSTSVSVVDKINIFRPDRVFMFILEIHYKIEAACHPRHRCHRLAGLEALIDILGHRAAVSSTYSYLLNLVGQFIDCEALHDQCSRLISALLQTLKSSPSKETANVLGEQLQFLVSKLVESCSPIEATGKPSDIRSSQTLFLLHHLTVDSDPSLHDYVRELEAFPEIDVFDGIREFHQELCEGYSLRDHLLKFVKRSRYLPPRLLFSSIRALHKQLLMGEYIWRGNDAKHIAEDVFWHDDSEIVHAVWSLVSMCGSDVADGIRPLVSDFVSKVGIGDPCCVVFRQLEDSTHVKARQTTISANHAEINLKVDRGISEDLLVTLLKLLKKYLMDDSVRIIDISSQALRGIVSTERGQRAIMSFDSYERSLIEIHSKGVNVDLVDKLLLDLERKFATEAIPLEESIVWETHNKTFEMWICPLVYSLIRYSCDPIIRLCQDVVMLKAEVAELLLPSIVVDLAGRKDVKDELQKLISSQVQKHIFVDSNSLIKSIQVFLNVLNELRLCYIVERSSLVVSKRESSKVYWLNINYLLVAKSAVICGSFFTSIMYIEYWCKEHFNGLTLGSPDFSHTEMLPEHIEILVSAVTQINEPDSLYGIVQSHKLTSQAVTFEREGNWSKALEYYDLQVRSNTMMQMQGVSGALFVDHNKLLANQRFAFESETLQQKPYKGLIRSLQQIGCTHVLDLYCQGLTSRKGELHHDLEFIELQYEAAWRAGNWDFSLPSVEADPSSQHHAKYNHFNENLHCCLQALQEGDFDEFHKKLKGSKQELVWSISCASEESTESIFSTIIQLQILYHLGMAWPIRWRTSENGKKGIHEKDEHNLSKPMIPTMEQLSWLNVDWRAILERTELHINLLEPFIAFRRVLLQILGCDDCSIQHLLQSASTLRKGSRLSQAAAALYEFKFLCAKTKKLELSSYWLGRLEEAKLLRAQCQHEMAISLAKYISENCHSDDETSNVYRLVGKWLAENRSSNSRTILEKYLKPAVSHAEEHKTTQKKSLERQSQCHFHLAHYADALFRSYEERLTSSEWKAAQRLRKHKAVELDALLRRLKKSSKGEKAEYSIKIQELQKQLAMDTEEDEKLKDDRDNFLSIALEGYKRCLVIGDKYDMRVVFRLISLWFNLSSKPKVIVNMLSTVNEVKSYKFLPLIYQIASRMGCPKDIIGPHNFQFALVSLVKKMAIDHPYHTIFQLLALANGDRIKELQRSRNSFVVDMDKIVAAKNLLEELLSYHGDIIRQMKQMVEIYIKLAELETRREDVNKRMTLPREIRTIRQLELVPVVTANFPIDRDCRYQEGSFPYFKGLADSVIVMNGINAPKVVECFGSDGQKYRQLAKSGNDDLRQDAVMEQFFGLVNIFLRNNRDTWRRRLGIRTYKVIPFTPSAGVLEWVNGTLPLGEYLIGSMRNSGAHGRYGVGDWSFLKCRENLLNAKDKRKAFHEVCENFRPVMHHFFLERFLQPADWFEKRLAYTRSVAASSMVGYIVGLGDRHSINILIDQATAEVVHIDLGVAFEQGLMLKTPERVPFRLTRDIIDGMGVTGVEGVFRRCCEETLSVMRTNKEALLTIVEVFIHDPLYKWALSPLKALQRQKETDDDMDASLEDTQDGYEGNKDATRALMRVKQKLDGYEGGELRSVHGQVQQLVQDAVDPERLCQMFPGWGAWL